MTDLISELKALGDPMSMTDFDCAFMFRNHLPTILAKLEEGERMREALRLVLPMAKGYAHEHPVGSNQEYVNHAVGVLESTHDHT